MSIPTITLNNGIEMPQLGFGVFQVPDDETTAAVAEALRVGYRSIDTAAVYGNEAGVGRAIADSGIDRSELFITSKVWNSDQGFDATLRAYDEALEKLGAWKALEGRVVLGGNVAAVLAYVERGEVAAAIVYRTEVPGAAGIEVLDGGFGETLGGGFVDEFPIVVPRAGGECGSENGENEAGEQRAKIHDGS